MKQISRITTQKKRKDRYNIYLTDGQKESYAFSVDEAVLIEFHLRKGLELDDAIIETLIQKDSLQKSYAMAINYLSYRMRTQKEIRDYLVKKEVEPEHIEKIMERLTREKLIDDKQFAEMFVRTRISTSSKGPLLIKKELIEKGVSADTASFAVEAYPYDIQYEKIQKWAEKKRHSNKKEAFQKQIQKLTATLAQKGFTSSVIQEALADLKDEKDDNEEWEAVVYQGDKLMRKHGSKLEGYELKYKVKQGLYRKGFTMDLINRYLDEQVEE